MSGFTPLSQRDDPSWHEPVAGLPPYLRASVAHWLRQYCYYSSHPTTPPRWNNNRLRDIEVALRIVPPLHRAGHSYAFDDLLERIEQSPDFGLDVIDYVLFRSGASAHAAMNELLLRGGSVWEVGSRADGTACLTRRQLGPIAEAVEVVRHNSERAHFHLAEAYVKLFGRNPDPSTAYRESVKAVEAVARPVIAPNDSLATLGKMISAVNAKPEKWTVILQHSTSLDIARVAAMLWKGQVDRHGSDDEDAPLSVSQEEADGAFHLALALVRFFAGGHIKRSAD